MAAVAVQGKSILVPLSDHLRYDFVFEDEHGQFFRVQCKNGRLINGRVSFYPCSVDSRSTTPSPGASGGARCPCSIRQGSSSSSSRSGCSSAANSAIGQLGLAKAAWKFAAMATPVP